LSSRSLHLRSRELGRERTVLKPQERLATFDVPAARD
jgi:hypothetical protein